MRVAWRREEMADGETAIVLALRVQPGATHTEVAGTHGAGTQMRLKIRLAAPPVDGKANAELLAFLARAFGVSRRDVTLLRGDASREKIVRIVRPRMRPDVNWE